MTKPTDVLDDADPGDEVLRRFRYQVAYAALKAISLLGPDSLAECIYCEHHEDVLIELSNGRFLGTQVKTREIGLAPFKSSDEAIRNALIRFCKEDTDYPNQFDGFCLTTNGAFFKGDGADDVRNIIETARTNPTLAGLTPRHSVTKALEDIVSETGLSLTQVTTALAKVQIEELHTGIDLDLMIVQALSQIDGNEQLRHVELLKAASLLREKIWSASSKSHSLAQLEASATTLNIAERTKSLTIANKRIAADIVHRCLKEAAEQTTTHAQELLAINDYLKRDGTPSSLSRMEAKMAVGDMTTLDVEQFKDDVRSLEYSFMRWTNKYDLSEANERLQHIQGLVLQQCRRSHDATQAPDGFKQPIITDADALRSRLNQLAVQEAGSLFGARPEHLLGAVGLLTDECKVWWSEPFELGSLS